MGGAGGQQSGVISVRSPLSLAETIKNLLIAVERRGMIVFARIDHAKAAEETGLRLRPAELFVFGYPEAEAPFDRRSSAFRPRFSPARAGAGRRAWWRLDELQRSRLAWRRYGVNADVIPKLEAIGASLAELPRRATIAKGDVAGG